jgi:hypothetical protein
MSSVRLSSSLSVATPATPLSLPRAYACRPAKDSARVAPDPQPACGFLLPGQDICFKPRGCSGTSQGSGGTEEYEPYQHLSKAEIVVATARRPPLDHVSGHPPRPAARLPRRPLQGSAWSRAHHRRWALGDGPCGRTICARRSLLRRAPVPSGWAAYTTFSGSAQGEQERPICTRPG